MTLPEDQLLGKGDKWRKGSLPSLSQLSVPLTAQPVPVRSPRLDIYPPTHRVRVYIQLRQPEMTMLDRERYTRLGSCWFHRKMVCWGGVRPRPGPRLPPLEGGGQTATQWAACCPPAGAQVTGETSCLLCCRRAPICRKGGGHGSGAGRARMDGADAPACSADLRRVHDRPRHRLARCLRLRCRCCASVAGVMSLSGAMRVDALGAVPSVQPQ